MKPLIALALVSGLFAASTFPALPSEDLVSLYTPSALLIIAGTLMLGFGYARAAGVCYAVMGLAGTGIALSIGVSAAGEPWRIDTAAEAAVAAARGELPKTLIGVLTHLPFGVGGLSLLLRERRESSSLA